MTHLVRVPAPYLQQVALPGLSAEMRKYRYAYSTGDGGWLIQRAYGACGGGWNVFDNNTLVITLAMLADAKTFVVGRNTVRMSAPQGSTRRCGR